MSLGNDVDLEEFVTTKDDLSGADIKAVCTEAGLLALRERRMRVTKADFTEAREKVRRICLASPLNLMSLQRSSTERTRVRPKVFTCSSLRATLSFRLFNSTASPYSVLRH